MRAIHPRYRFGAASPALRLAYICFAVIGMAIALVTGVWPQGVGA